MYEQVELVEEAMAQQPADGGGAAGHGDVATVLGLDVGDLLGNVAADNLRVLPRRRLQAVGDHVLLHRVHDVAEGLVRVLGPVRGPLVVEDPAHEHGVGGREAGADRGPHLVVEVREVPLVGRLDDAVEGNEEVRLDLAHWWASWLGVGSLTRGWSSSGRGARPSGVPIGEDLEGALQLPRAGPQLPDPTCTNRQRCLSWRVTGLPGLRPGLRRRDHPPTALPLGVVNTTPSGRDQDQCVSWPSGERSWTPRWSAPGTAGGSAVGWRSARLEPGDPQVHRDRPAALPVQPGQAQVRTSGVGRVVVVEGERVAGDRLAAGTAH